MDDDYWAAWWESGVEAASDRVSHTGGECDKAFARLLNTPADSVQDMETKRRAALIQEQDGDDNAPTELIEALGRDFERLAGGLPS